MKMSTALMRTKVDAAIARNAAEVRAKHAEQVRQHEEAVAAWREKKQPELLATLRSFVERTRRGQIVTHGHLRAAFDPSYSTARLGYDGPSMPDPLPDEIAPWRELGALRDLLATVTDDEISSSTLRDFGFRNATAWF